VVFSPDGQTLASGSEDGTIKIWKVPSRKESSHPPIPIVGDFFSKLWNMQRQNFMASYEKGSYLYLSGFSLDSQTLTITANNSEIIMWDWQRNRKEISTLKGATKSWRSIVFSPDGKSIALR
jgi:hypothetical protein